MENDHRAIIIFYSDGSGADIMQKHYCVIAEPHSLELARMMYGRYIDDSDYLCGYVLLYFYDADANKKFDILGEPRYYTEVEYNLKIKDGKTIEKRLRDYANYEIERLNIHKGSYNGK